MAKVLARSLAIHSPDIPSAVVTDSSDRGLADLYDHVVQFRPEFGSGLTQKVYLDAYSPFKETLFIDSDCLVIRDISYLWTLCNSQVYLAGSLACLCLLK